MSAMHSACSLHKHYYNTLIVFYGYDGGRTTKDETHQRKTGSEMGVEVDFTLDMLLRMKKKSILANQKNKQTFINLLTVQTKKEGDIQVENSIAEADFDIAMFACKVAITRPVVVVGMTQIFGLCW